MYNVNLRNFSAIQVRRSRLFAGAFLLNIVDGLQTMTHETNLVLDSSTHVIKLRLFNPADDCQTLSQNRYFQIHLPQSINQFFYCQSIQVMTVTETV